MAELLFLDGVGPRHLRVLKERKEEGEKKKKGRKNNQEPWHETRCKQPT